METTALTVADEARLGRYGRYEIVRKLAVGGMGEVFLARLVGAAGFRRHVVIKRILPHLVEQQQFVESLVREAKLLVMLDHPNIVQVLDLGEEHGDYFMAMEFVHGYNMATIAHYCAQTHHIIPAACCGYIALQILAGLDYAHSMVGADGLPQNVIHRDVSPQNVLISRDGRVKLADFGIAKVIDQAEAEYTRSLKGKFRYMAPEAVDGGRIDRRYDLFAVGILLFEGLCRRHLFGGKSDVEILNQVKDVRVPPIARYHPGVSPTLVAVVERALMRDADRRFQSAADFSRALRAALPVDESEAGRMLRAFVEDLYERADFPINKPKLPDINAPDPTVSRALKLQSSVTIEPKVAEPPSSGSSSQRSRGMLAIWIALVLVAAAVGGLAFVLLRQPTQSADRPVIIVNSKKPADAALTTADLLAASPDARLVGRPTPQRAISFTEQVGRRTFARAGRRLKRCFDTYGPRQGISLSVISTIARSGRVTGVRIEPTQAAAGELARCILGVARGLRYPRHDKAFVTFVQPLRVQPAP